MLKNTQKSLINLKMKHKLPSKDVQDRGISTQITKLTKTIKNEFQG